MAYGDLDSDLPNVNRFWKQVRETPQGEHVYAALLGLRTYHTSGLHSRLEEGLSSDSLERLRKVLDVPASRMARLLLMSPRTLARRMDAGRLEPEESDRLLRLTRLVGMALRLFEGNLPDARAWLSTRHRFLGGKAPLEYAVTDVGAREVEHLIGRLEHGAAL